MSFTREHFRFCPKCRSERIQIKDKLLSCADCSLHFYQNTATAVAGLLVNSKSELLVLKRAKEPSKGKLAFPGGFVDAAESAEQALTREVKEEIGIDFGDWSYLGSHPNLYRYREIDYPTVDLFFMGRIEASITQFDSAEVLDPHWIFPSQIGADELAFPSLPHGVNLLRKKICV
jgi:mutator protein MutT